MMVKNTECKVTRTLIMKETYWHISSVSLMLTSGLSYNAVQSSLVKTCPTTETRSLQAREE